MVKIYFDKKLNFNIVNYIFTEIFRYIDIDFSFTEKLEESNIIYANLDKKYESKIQITPSEQFWNNYKTIKSLPTSPLIKKDKLTYIYYDDIIASTFFMLSGYEEYLNPKRDKFERFLYQYSYYKKDEIYTKPIIEQYRELLIKQLNNIGIKCKRKNIWNDKELGLFLTHDVDGVYKYRNTLKSIVKIILKPSKFKFKELIDSKKNINTDPYFKGFKYLSDVSKKYNFKSSFFFIAKVREKRDDFYSIKNKAIVTLMKKFKKQHFEIGLHGTLQSYNNERYLKDEYTQIENVYGIRQHYLKYDIYKTSSIQNKFFKYDSTLCFADMIGFRRGTCMPFRLYDINQDKKLELFEIPLIVMDQTLKGYMKLEPKEAYFQVIKIIEMIKSYNGLFTFLWHPGNCSDEWEKWIRDVYENILIYLLKKKIDSKTGKELYGIINDFKKY